MKKFFCFMFIISYFCFADVSYDLFYAVADSDIKLAEQLIKKGGKLETTSIMGSTLLMVAAEKGDLKMLNLLISKGAKLNAKNSMGLGALEVSPDFFTINYLISKGVPFADPLNQAINSNNYKKVKDLIEKGELLDYEYGHKITPLMVASYRNNNEILNLLINKGSNLEAVDQKGNTPLIWAVANKSKDSIKSLFEMGSKINTLNFDNFSAMLIACSLNYPDIVDCLKNLGASYEQDDNYFGPYNGIICSAINDSYEVAKYLIEDGCNLNTYRYGQSPIMYAAINNSIKVGKLLIDNRANIEEQDEDGYTPLMLAIKYEKKEFIELLILSGANLKTKYFDKSMLSLTNSSSMREFLLSKGIKW